MPSLVALSTHQSFATGSTHLTFFHFVSFVSCLWKAAHFFQSSHHSPSTTSKPSVIILCLSFHSVTLRRPPAKRCEGGTKCFLLSINNVLYACMALGLPDGGREGRKKGRCLQRFIYCLISLSQNFSQLFFCSLSPSSVASSGLHTTRQ